MMNGLHLFCVFLQLFVDAMLTVYWRVISAPTWLASTRSNLSVTGSGISTAPSKYQHPLHSVQDYIFNIHGGFCLNRSKQFADYSNSRLYHASWAFLDTPADRQDAAASASGSSSQSASKAAPAQKTNSSSGGARSSNSRSGSSNSKSTSQRNSASRNQA